MQFSDIADFAAAETLSPEPDQADVAIAAQEGGADATGKPYSPIYPAGATYGDARVLTDFDERDYGNRIIIANGANCEAKNWNPMTMEAGAFIAKLCQHREGTKDGPSFLMGDIVPGRRNNNTVKALYLLGLDIDTGTPSEVVDAAIAGLGCQAVRYSTHSHLKAETQIKKDTILKWAGGREIDTDSIREYLRNEKRWDANVANNAEFAGTDHTEKGIVVRITHPPMPKHRVIVVLQDPFVIAKEGATQSQAIQKWERIPEAFANLLGLPFDRSCKDPARLFYYPRHTKGDPFEVSLFGGHYFDWRSLELGNANELGRGKSKSVTEEGRKLGRWSIKRAHGFQIADVIEAYCPERKRHNTGRGLEIECPFDENHTYVGDPDDRACFVVNAGEGQSELFTITCRHDSCQDKTNLDMLGKMLANGWFDRDVLTDESFNAILCEGESPDSDNASRTNEQPALTPESVESAIQGFGPKPRAKDLTTLLDQIAAVQDDGWRDALFDAARDGVKGERKETVKRARSRAAKKWKAAAQGAAKPESATSDIPLPEWGHSYGKFNGRSFVFGRTEEGEQGQPLHSPLRIMSAVVYADRKVQGREVTEGVLIEFENRKGERKTIPFTRSQALLSPKEGMIADLVNAGVAFTPSGISALQNGILAGGALSDGGVVRDYPGWHGDVFITPGGEVIGQAEGIVTLDRPLPGIRRLGTSEGWRKAVAPAFSPEVIAIAPQFAACTLWGYVSPLMDRAQEGMSMVLSLAGRTSTYKTFPLQLMASVWGSLTPTLGILVTFSATANRLECYAIERSGCALALDETTLFEGDKLCPFIYRIVTGAERGRYKEDSRFWRIAAALSSEVPITQLIRAAGGEAPPGLMSRVVEIPTTGETLPDWAIQSLRAAADTKYAAHYGHAGPEFVSAMLAAGWTRERIADAVAERVAVLCNTGGREQERRASRAIAYIGLAGEIAQRAGLIPKGFDVSAFTASLWERCRGAADTSAGVVSRVCGHLAEKLRTGSIPILGGKNEIALSTSGASGAICLRQFGPAGDPVFVVPKGSFKRIIGLREDERDAAGILDANGFLYREQKDRLTWRGDRLGVGNVPAYVVYATAVLGSNAQEDIDDYFRARLRQQSGQGSVVSGYAGGSTHSETKH